MSKITDISRTGIFAWGQSSSSLPLLATGTAAGALDESFSSEGKLELWDVFPDPNATPAPSKSQADDGKDQDEEIESDFLIGDSKGEDERSPLASLKVNSRSALPPLSSSAS